MNKLLTKIVGVVLGTTMAVGVGVGVAVNSNRDAVDSEVRASEISSGTTTYTFSSKSWEASPRNWTSGSDGAGFSNNGIQVTTAATGANGTSPDTFVNVSKIVLTYNTNKSKGAGTATVKVGTNTDTTKDWAYSGSSDGTSANFTLQYDYATAQSGAVKITLNTTTNSIYLVSCTVTCSSAPATYSVTYDANGATSGNAPVDGNTYTAQSNTVTVLGSGNLAKEHHEFVEWNTSADGSGTGYDENDTFTISANTTLYAIWNQTEFVVSYDANNEDYTGSTPSSDIVQSGGSHTVASALSLSGYTFVAWNTSADGNGTDYSAGATISDITTDITLFGRWQEAPDALAGTSWTYTFTAKTFTSNNQTVLLSGTANSSANKQNWTLVNNGSYYGYDGTKGQQVGSGSETGAAHSMTLSTTAFSGAAKISSVAIATSGASSVTANISVTVGETSFKCNDSTTASISASNTTYTFSGTGAGTVSIIWNQSSNKALYFKTITVTYEIEASVVATDVTVTGSQSVNGSGNATVQSTYSYGITYEQGKAGDESNVTVSVSPAAYATVGAVSNKQFTVTFKKATNFTITVSSTETVNVKGTLAVTVSNVVHVCYERLNSEVTLYAGMKLLIVEPTSSMAAGAINAKNRLVGEDVTLSDSIIETSDIGSAKEFTLGGTVNNWTLTSSEGLLGVKSVNNLAYDDANATTTWTITVSSSVGSEGKASITSTGDGLGTIRFNYNSDQLYFTTYTSTTMYLPEIYVKTAENNVYGMIESTMRMGDTALAGNGSDACKNSGYYLAAKVALSKLSQSERNSFRDDDNSKYTAALARYNAWARANHDANPFDGKDEIASANSLFGNAITNSTAVVATVVIISVIGLSTLCGYFLLRKRKEER